MTVFSQIPNGHWGFGSEVSAAPSETQNLGLGKVGIGGGSTQLNIQIGGTIAKNLVLYGELGGATVSGRPFLGHFPLRGAIAGTCHPTYDETVIDGNPTLMEIEEA